MRIPDGLQVTGEATLTVKMEPVNQVTEVQLSMATEASLTAGDEAIVRAVLCAEDGNTVPSHDAVEGLALKLNLPNGQTRELGPCDTPTADAGLWPDGALAYATGEMTHSGETLLCIQMAARLRLR